MGPTQSLWSSVLLAKLLELLLHLLLQLRVLVRFQGFVEGTDLTKGTADVVVTDGFSGNIALKTMEGTAKLIKSIIEESIRASIWGKLGYLLARPIFQRMKDKMDPRDHNGAMMLGLNGVVIKSHGSADARSFANAILVTKQLIEQRINDRITEEMSRLHELDNTQDIATETEKAVDHGAEVIPLKKER